MKWISNILWEDAQDKIVLNIILIDRQGTKVTRIFQEKYTAVGKLREIDEGFCHDAIKN